MHRRNIYDDDTSNEPSRAERHLVAGRSPYQPSLRNHQGSPCHGSDHYLDKFRPPSENWRRNARSTSSPKGSSRTSASLNVPSRNSDSRFRRAVCSADNGGAFLLRLSIGDVEGMTTRITHHGRSLATFKSAARPNDR